MPDTRTSSANEKYRRLLGLIRIVQAVLALPAVGMALLSPMAFDSGDSTENWVLFAVLISFPLLLLFSYSISQQLLVNGKPKPAILVCLLPLVPLIVSLFMPGMWFPSK